MQIYINEEFCKGCEFCVHFCATKVLAMSNELGSKGNLVAMVKDPDKCTACKLCELVCPDFAISVETDPHIYNRTIAVRAFINNSYHNNSTVRASNNFRGGNR